MHLAVTPSARQYLSRQPGSYTIDRLYRYG